MLDRWFSRMFWLSPVPLRLAVGAVFIMHGSQKLFGSFGGPGMAGVTGMVEHLGFAPAWLWAWLLAVTEFIGGLLLVLGLFTRYAALALTVDMGIAIYKVHLAHGFFAPQGVEFPLTLLAGLISLLFSGPGGLTLHTGKK